MCITCQARERQTFVILGKKCSGLIFSPIYSKSVSDCSNGRLMDGCRPSLMMAERRHPFHHPPLISSSPNLIWSDINRQY